MYRTYCALDVNLLAKFNLVETFTVHDHDTEVLLSGGQVKLIFREPPHISATEAYYEVRWCNYQYLALYQRRSDGDYDVVAVTTADFMSVLFKALDPEEDYIFVGGRDLGDFPDVYEHV